MKKTVLHYKQKKEKKTSPKKQNLQYKEIIDFRDSSNGIIYMQVYDKESELPTHWSSKVPKHYKVNVVLDLQITDQI